MIDAGRALGAELPPGSFEWSEDDVILYHLAIGAGSRPTDPTELRYAYEGDLIVLPTFGTVASFAMMAGLGAVEGIELDLTRLLHGEQELLVHRPIPTSGTVHHEGRVAAVYDKGKGALVVLEIESRLATDGELLFTNRPSVYLRGEGGFGGPSGPPAGGDPPPRQPDFVVDSPTLPQQALLYRIASGDHNPLHADPAFAAFAGFERPILHGLCTYGIVGKAVVDSALDSEPDALESLSARFSGAVFPGETVVTRIWEEDGHLLVAATTAERGEPVISNGVARIRR